MKKTRISLVFSLLMTVMLVFTSCSGSGSGTSKAKEKTGDMGFIELAQSEDEIIWYQIVNNPGTFNKPFEETQVLGILVTKNGKADYYDLGITDQANIMDQKKREKYQSAGLKPMTIKDLAGKTDEELLKEFKEFDKKAFEVERKELVDSTRRVFAGLKDKIEKVESVTYDDYRKINTNVEVKGSYVESGGKIEREFYHYFCYRPYQAMLYLSLPDNSLKKKDYETGKIFTGYVKSLKKKIGDETWNILYTGNCYITRQLPNVNIVVDKKGTKNYEKR